MGVWGTGLYSGDFAMDLRGTIGAILRLPFSDEALLEVIQSTEQQAAESEDDPDHTTFWLVVADQFSKRGIDCKIARDRAIAIIDTDADLRMNQTLGLDEKSLTVRRKMLDELRSSLLRPVATAKPRKTLKKPQPLIYDVGDVFIYPTCGGDSRNPYNVNPEWEWVKRWKQDGWGAMVIVERGQYLGYLAWYRPITPAEPWTEEPGLSELFQPRRWFCNLAGTLIPTHERQLKLKRVGSLTIDREKFERAFPVRGNPRTSALIDRSIANEMQIRDQSRGDDHRAKYGIAPTPRIESLREIVA